MSSWITTKAQTDTIDFIEMSLEELMNVKITSASKKSESNFESPLSTTVLSRQEILNSGATTIGESLRLVPGLIVREETNGNYDIHMRGFDNITPDAYLNNTENTFSLVMIDNRVVYSYFQGGTLWETIPIDINDIDRIEIIRGPATALYGPNAINGVIHIITRRGEEKSSINGHFEAGNFSMKNGQLSGFLPIKNKLTIGISGNYQIRENYTDKYYVNKKNDYYTLSEIDTLTYTGRMPFPPFMTIKDKIINDVYKYYPGGNNSMDKYGVNGYITYKENEDVNLDLSVGTQNSEGQMMTMQSGIYPTTRNSNSQYINLNGNTYKVISHISYTQGEQNLAVGNPDFHYDYKHLDGNVEYDLNLKSLNIRPGISYQSAIYDVSNYVDASKQEGYFKGAADLNSIGATLRNDYKLFNERLRLIAALRLDKYNIPDKTYFSYQFISTFKITNNHILRAVYSKANRSPFILSSYADYYIMNPIKIIGNNNLNLITQNTIEFGIRNKWADNFQTELEVFYAEMKNFETIKFIGIPMASNMQYTNNTINANQTGATISATTFITKNLNVKIFGTLQSTEMKNYAPNQNIPDSLITGLNKWTPSIYSGLTINYNFIQKANLNVSAYYMSKQEINALLLGKIVTQKIDPSLIINAKASYKVYKNNSVFVNFRNIAGGQQFPFILAPKLFVMGGISLNL